MSIIRPTALITGGSRGIGEAIVLNLAKDGYDVIINYRNSEKKAIGVLSKVEEMGGRGIAVKADVSNPLEVARMFEKARNPFGNVDLLVCNAAVAKQIQFQDITQNQWRQFFATNVDGVFNTIKEALPYICI